jgi:hypothetical protein
MVVTSKLRRHKVMERAMRALMGNNLPPRFKFKDTYDSIQVPTAYQQHLPSQATLEAKFDELIAEEDVVAPTTQIKADMVVSSNLEVGTSNLFVDTETGNVGIGTNSPGFSLDVHGTANVGALTATSVSGPLSGNADTATQVNNSLTPGSYLSGLVFNGSTARTFAVDATTTNTASKIVARDGNGDIFGRYLHGAYLNMSHGVGTRSTDTVFYSSTDNYIRKTNATGMRASLNVPTRTGGNASGTWGINITGNAGTATTATNQSGGTVSATSYTLTGDSTPHKQSIKNSANLSVGWYRIAENGNAVDGASNGSRCSARFTIIDYDSGKHSTRTLYAGGTYGNKPFIHLLTNTSYGSDGSISKVRVVNGGVYEGLAVEIYVDTACNANDIRIVMDDNYQGTGFTMVNFESVVANHSNMNEYELDLNTTFWGMFLDNTTKNICMLENGNIGIGVTDPTAKLHVNGGITKTQYNPGEVIEELHSVCNSTSLHGRATIQNVTGYYAIPQSYGDATGSVVTNYTPPTGTKTIVYEFVCMLQWFDAHAISHWRLYFKLGSGSWVEVSKARYSRSGYYPEDKVVTRWVFTYNASSADNSLGVITGTPVLSFKWMVRDYGGSNERGGLHRTQYWDGGGTDMYSQPMIMIKAIA